MFTLPWFLHRNDEGARVSGGGYFVSDPQLWVRNANQLIRLVARFTGYSQTATFTYDLASLRELPRWPNIMACGTSAQRAAGSSE